MAPLGSVSGPAWAGRAAGGLPPAPFLLSGQGRADAVRHPVGGVLGGAVGQMDVALGGLDQGMAEQLGNGHHVHAVHGGGGRPAMAKVVRPQAGQIRLGADAVPLEGDVVDGPRRRTGGEEIRTIGAVSRNGVDHGARGAGQPHRARSGFRVGQEDALVPDPVPFERGDLAEAAAGQHQQPDDGDDVRAPELVAGQHGVEPGHLVRRQESLLRLRLVAPRVLAGIGVVAAVSPKLGHAHHDRQGRHGAVGDGGPVGHGRKPVPDMLDGDGVHGHVAEGGQNVIADDVGAGRQRRGLPVPRVAFEKLGGESLHRMAGRPGSVVLLRRFDVAGDQPAGLAPRLGDRHGLGAADGGVAPAPAHHAGKEEGPDSGGLDGKRQPAHHVVADFVLGGSGSGGADAPGEGGFFGHGRGSLFGPRGWPVMQEAAAAAFRRGSRAAARDATGRKAL